MILSIAAEKNWGDYRLNTQTEMLHADVEDDGTWFRDSTGKAVS